MKKTFKLTAVTAGILAAGTLAASAAVLDFTDNGSYSIQGAASASGSFHGVGWTLTPSTDPLTYETPGPGAVGILAGENDGVGINDDEITNSPSVMEYVTLTFDEEVTIIGLAFLDLFKSPREEDHEVADLFEGVGTGGTLLGSFDAVEVYQGVPGGNPGYAYYNGLGFTGTTFTFASETGNDSVGKADYALGAVELAPIPLPAGVLLLGGALAGLGFARRRKA